MEAAICIEGVYPERPPQERVGAVAEHGFRAVEFWAWRDKNLPALREACRESGVAVVNFSAHRRGSPVARDTHDIVLDDFRDALEAARLLGCPRLMFLSNELGEGGAVVDAFPEITDEAKRAHFLELLGRANSIAPPEMELLIEPLNTVADHPGCYLSDMATASDIVRAVGSPRVKILCDLYHMAMMGADLEALVREYAPDIGYVHVADVPGRHEPGTGTVDWRRVLGALGDTGYDGWVGFEYFPAADSERSLARIRRLWEEVSG